MEKCPIYGRPIERVKRRRHMLNEHYSHCKTRSLTAGILVKAQAGMQTHKKQSEFALSRITKRT